MNQPYPAPQPHPEPRPQAAPRPAKFGGLAWSALILGIVGIVGSPIIIFNNITAIAAGVGVVLGIIALFGTRKVLAGIGTALCVGAIAITVAAQQAAVEELDRIVNDPAAAPTLPSTETAVEVAEERPRTNERNHIAMALGDEAWTGPKQRENGPEGTTFVIDEIEVDPACDAYGIAPDAGHTLLLHVRVATGTDQLAAQDAAYVLNPFNFVEIGKDGVTTPAQVGACTDYAKALPQTFGINQQYTGTIELVVAQASGTLGLAPGSTTGGPAGWEWSY
ncbi:hypothetical protein SacmaDRAFT_1685 [Saccharomonospora marina XMU15]|uniref:DUF4190 domain-containing protein n=1 Tax=Saccharomonospora marina XMU15 TaxID=882083 RepID=H5X4F3_9PSEU|nr:hypothetical protein [Saccharomonospora marina]EHR49955.1 hypothetical protein SacmaDRAFT_1685 [Saccharomonospora marina XMU15]